MRGTPWIRFLAMTAVLALIAVPLWLLTWPEPAVRETATTVQDPTSEREVALEIETAPAAQTVGAKYLSRDLISPAHTSGSFSGTIRLPADSPADLVVTAKWNLKQTTALRVRAWDKTGLLAEASFWGADDIQDVFTIPETSQ
jgi:hypothetical protein